MVRIAVVLLLVLAGISLAQDCVDWTDTMPPPVEYPEIGVGSLHLVGDLLVSIDPPSISVYRLSADHQVDPLGVVPFEGWPRRARVIEGELYLALGSEGVLHVDLSDPTNPTVATVFDPFAVVFDLTAFDGGFAVLAEDTLYAVDRLDGSSPSVISTVAMEAEEIIAAGSHVFAGGERLSVIDFTDIEQPVFVQGEGHYPGEHPSQYMTPRFSGMAIRGDRLYTKASYHNLQAGVGDGFLFAFDISEPMEPEVAATVRTDDSYGDLRPILLGQYLVRNDHYANLEFVRLDDLETIAMVAVGAIVGDPVVFDDQLYVKATHSHTLHRLDCSHVRVVNPVIMLGANYQPLDCGPVGFAARTVYGHYLYETRVDSVGWVIYDQSNPTNSTVVHSHMIDVWEDDENPCSFGSAIVAYNEHWTVVRSWKSCYYYGLQSIHVHCNESWERASVAVDSFGDVVLDGDVLWIRESRAYYDSHLSTYQLSPGEMTLLDKIEVPSGLGRLDLAKDVTLAVGDVMLVYDRYSPDHIELIEERSLAPLEYLFQSGRVDGDLLYCLAPTGFTVIDLNPPTPSSPVVRSSIDLAVTGSDLAWNGDRVMVYGQSGYQIVDVADPDAIAVMTDRVPLDVRAAVWNGDHLYVGGSQTLYLYDMSNPSSPVWMGQAQGEISVNGACVRNGYLMMGQAVLLPDCQDPTPIEGDPDTLEGDIELPPRSVLHPPAPNPFNPRTTIGFTLACAQQVDLEVFDVRGRLLANLLSRRCEAGHHQLHWTGLDQSGRPLSSGTYMVRLRTETDVSTQKVVLVR